MPKTINPFNEELIEEYNYISREEIEDKINFANDTFLSWKNTPNSKKKELCLKLADLMMKKIDELAKLDTLEM